MKRLLALTAAALAISCAKNNEPIEPNQLNLFVGIDVPISKAELNPTTGATNVQFLRINAATSPTDFSAATPLMLGNIAPTTGKVTFTTTVPTYIVQSGTNAWLIAYYPAATPAAGAVTWTIDGKTDIMTTDQVWNAGSYHTPLTGASGTKLTLNHCLSQIAVVCQAKTGQNIANVQLSWGKVKKIEFLEAPTTISYNLNGLSSTPGTTKQDFALLKDYNGTAFAPITIPAAGTTTVAACAMLAPIPATATESFRLRITTDGETTADSDDIVLTTPISLNNNRTPLAAGKTHTITVVFKTDIPDLKEIEVLSTSVENWISGYSSENYIKKQS